MTSRKEELQRALEQMAHKHDKKMKGKHAAGDIAAPQPDHAKPVSAPKPKSAPMKPVGRMSAPRGK